MILDVNGGSKANAANIQMGIFKCRTTKIYPFYTKSDNTYTIKSQTF